MGLAVFLEVFGRDEQRRQFALGTGSGLQADRGQTGDFLEVLLHAVQQFQHPLDCVIVLQRVQVGETWEPGNTLMPLRVVLHRATSQRVEVGVDAHVAGREIRIVADQVDLANLRQRRRGLRQVPLREQFVHRLRWHIALGQPVAPATGAGHLEKQFGRLRVVHGKSNSFSW